MTNEQDADKPPANPENPSPHRPIPSPTTPPQGEVRSNPRASANGDQKTARELAREFRWVEGAQLIVNGVLAIVGIIALCIYNGQLTVMRGQLGEIVKQYPELQKSSSAAIASANAAKIAADAAQKSIDIATQSDRPWVGSNGIDSVAVGDSEVHFSPHIINSGRRTAYVIKAEWNYHLYKSLPANPEYRKGKPGHPLSSTYILVPGKDTRAVTEDVILTQQNMADIVAGKLGLYYYMRLDYRDIGTQQVHHTKLCWFFVTVNTTGVCNEYNSAD
jgi:hypothetical protein